MAIQEIEKAEVTGSIGIGKELDAAAVGMIMDVVQAQQYQKPIQSAVREIVANSVDSQNEKEKAILILTGQAKPEDYFIKRDGELYKDSNWDPSYYDMNHLDTENNSVELIYKRGNGIGRCDSFIVKDYGVGLGKTRLHGYTKLGFSSKRNRTDALGAFGLGAKAGLSTGASFFIMTTVYNGIKYKLKIFNKSFNSLINKFNLETGEENIPYEIVNKGKVVGLVYGEKTDEKNYTQIEVPCLPHHQSEYDLAVKTQLLFFRNVNYYHEDEDGDRTEIHFKTQVHYNSDNLIICDNSPYSKPYIVIINGNNNVGVCYGFIDFNELELQEMRGSIGIKCRIRQIYTDENGEEVVLNQGVDITPSRENIRWTAHTRDYILAKFKEAQTEATNLVEDELREEDFLKWLAKCKDIASFQGHSVIGKLSKIVELSNLSPKFIGTNIRYRNDAKIMFPHFKIRKYSKVTKDNKLSIHKEDVTTLFAVDFNSLYFQDRDDEEFTESRIKNSFLCDTHSGTFYTIFPPQQSTLENWKLGAFGKDAEVLAREIEKIEQYSELFKSSSLYREYNSIEVPEDYTTKIKNIDEGKMTVEGREIEVRLTAAERREMEGTIVVHGYGRSYYSQDDSIFFYKNKNEVSKKTIEDSDDVVYYGEEVDFEKVQLALEISYPTQRHFDSYIKGTPSICSISKANKKYFKHKNHINDFFGKSKIIRDEFNNYKGLELMVDNAVIRWNTARIISNTMGEIPFFNNFAWCNSEMRDLYFEVKNYYSSNYEVYPNSIHKKTLTIESDFVKFLDNLQELQEVLTVGEPEEIKEKAIEISNRMQIGEVADYKKVLVVDTTMIEKMNKILEYANPLKNMLNSISLLTLKGEYSRYYITTTPDVDIELQIEINEYINLKTN